jgi:uncharacterized phage infection (PIP) family protein YhgE
MELSPSVHIGFLVASGLWATLKGIKHGRERAEKNRLDDTLERISTSSADLQSGEKQSNNTLEKMATSISHLQQAINELPGKIARPIKPSRSEGNQSE